MPWCVSGQENAERRKAEEKSKVLSLGSEVEKPCDAGPAKEPKGIGGRTANRPGSQRPRPSQENAERRKALVAFFSFSWFCYALLCQENAERRNAEAK